MSTCSDVVKKIGVKYVDNVEEKALKHHHVASINFQMESWGREIGFRIQSICARMLNENIESSAGVFGELGAAKMDLQQCLQAENEASRGLFQDLMIPHLAKLAKKLLGLETVAAEASENLVDLTSSDGEWFLLDEIQIDVIETCFVFLFLGRFFDISFFFFVFLGGYLASLDGSARLLWPSGPPRP